MTRRDWWLGVALIVGAVLAHALIPRYEWRQVSGSPQYLLRVDRWLGQWRSLAAPRRIIGYEPLPDAEK